MPNSYPMLGALSFGIRKMKNAPVATATRRNEAQIDAPLTVTLPANLSATIRLVARMKDITPEEEVLAGLASMCSDVAQCIYSDSDEAEAWLLGKDAATADTATGKTSDRVNIKLDFGDGEPVVFGLDRDVYEDFTRHYGSTPADIRAAIVGLVKADHAKKAARG